MAIVIPSGTTVTGGTISIDFGSSVAFDSIVYTGQGRSISAAVNEEIHDGGLYDLSSAGQANVIAGAAFIPCGPFTDAPTPRPVTPDSYGQHWLTLNSKRRYLVVNVTLAGGETAGTVTVGFGQPPPSPLPPILAPVQTDPANPSIIAGGLSASWVGPVSYGEFLYVVQQSSSSSSGAVYVYKFTLGGDTFTAVGGACPITGSFDYNGATQSWDGDHTITIAAMDGSSQTPWLVDFDLATETWGAPYGTSGGPALKSVYALYQRPDNSFLLIGMKDAGSADLPACVYSGGAWGSPFDIAANMVALGYVAPSSHTGFDALNPPKSCMDLSGNLYVFWQVKGATVFPTSADAGPNSAWYGRAFYQRIAADNSTPSGAGNFYDFPGQADVVSSGGSFPTFKDGDLAWNTFKGSVTAGFGTFTDSGGDAFGKPCISGTSIIVPIRRKIPGSLGFYNANTKEQFDTYCTLYIGAGLPAPVFTEVTQGVDPDNPTTSANKCDSVCDTLYDAGSGLLSIVYTYSTIIAGDPHTANNTANQQAVRLCRCRDITGTPESWTWEPGVTVYDIADPVGSVPYGFDGIFDTTVTLYGTTVVILTDGMFLYGCGDLWATGVHVLGGLGLGPVAELVFPPVGGGVSTGATELFLWLYQGVPNGVLEWATQPSNFGIQGFKSIPRMGFTYTANADVTFLVTSDGTSPASLTLPGTSGLAAHVYFNLTPNKGNLYAFAASSTDLFQIILAECSFSVAQWGRTGEMAQLHEVV